MEYIEFTQNAQPAGKKNHPAEWFWKGAGHIYVLKGRTRMTRPMTLLEGKRLPRSQVPQKQTLRANQLHAKITQKTNFVTLQIQDDMPVPQYVITDPPMINFRQYIKDTNGIPSVVWQQQMEKTYIKIYQEVHNNRPDRYYELDYTKDFET